MEICITKSDMKVIDFPFIRRWITLKLNLNGRCCLQPKTEFTSIQLAKPERNFEKKKNNK